ncbi:MULTISPECIES: DoxX family membrane protein [unclassified Streptomyces]|uniref:DoxX family membrane protein n=1 Tax=unclassified Streptomyces TaxID=2593676 RepID=UPI001BE7D088|nr:MULTISPECIES: DoxX family membrane protein [unclassified Streptomyces]MBT2408374.1 DoxX family membrane protein [Streptomyces sp. ISL-21]MBT2457955.1 DoxX family membrane protein [Streptomyces sp. ISL-86]MBT2611687.1 DoxX family membrane protein [Streptomyces sp. ISL-87]
MSVDTRTSGFDDQPALSMVKVPCDPAQVIVNHASFRVRLAPSPSARSKPANAPSRAPVLGAAAVAAAGVTRRRAPVVWSGKSANGDSGATGGLLQAVREVGRGHDDYGDGGATQVIPRLDLAHDLADNALATPTIIGQRTYGDPDETRPMAAVRDLPHYAGPAPDPTADSRRNPPDARGQASYYPGRRMNLGVVLLPLRVFLGFISIYAGMGKLCDPVYFDGGERGSMVTWLRTLHPWALAEPLRDFALAHPVGAGLSVAFLQVIVGVLTVFGLWQRFAACFGALLSAALLMTVSWKTVPAYDAPDIIYLAAWSPLIIAGAPVYSLDGRLAGEAWRTLGPRSEIWRLRRRVLRRGAVMATVVCGLTLLIGSVLGGAVRSTTVVTVPGPGQAPSNYLPGTPLPQTPAKQAPTRQQQQQPSKAASPSASASKPATKSGRTGSGSTSKATSGTGAQSPSASRTGTSSQTPRSSTPRQSAPQPPPSSTSGSGSGGDTPTAKPGLVGGLLG